MGNYVYVCFKYFAIWETCLFIFNTKNVDITKMRNKRRSYWVECSRSIKLTALLPNSPIKLTALLS